MCTTHKMVVAMDRDGNTSSVCGHGYWRLGLAAMKKDAGVTGSRQLKVQMAIGADGTTVWLVEMAAVTRAWCALGRCRWQWRLG